MTFSVSVVFFFAFASRENADRSKGAAGERNDNGETTRGARRVGCHALPRRRRARPAGARPDECAARAETQRGTPRAARRDVRRSPSSRRLSDSVFKNHARGTSRRERVVPPRDSTHLQQRNRLLHLRLFFALALEHRGTFGQSSAGGHSGAPASARERAIRQQKKTNDSGSRLGCVGVAGGASGGPPTHHVRCRLGKKKHVVYETHSTRASSAKRLKSKTQRVHACSLWILSPSRARRQNFAAANHGVRVRRFTLARSRPRGSALPSVDCPRRSGGGHFGARTRR